MSWNLFDCGRELTLRIRTRHSVLEVIRGYDINRIQGNNRVLAKHMSHVLESVQQLHVTVGLFSSVSY